MVARKSKFRKGDVIRLVPRADRGSDSVYSWLKDQLGHVVSVGPYGWDVLANFNFTIEHCRGAVVYNRDFGFWDFDIELVKR